MQKFSQKILHEKEKPSSSCFSTLYNVMVFMTVLALGLMRLVYNQHQNDS